MPKAASASTVEEFLAGLPPERRREIERVRAVVRKNLPAGYEEVVSSNMLVYQVPLERYADTYNGRPLWYAALASLKNYLTLYLMPAYADSVALSRLEKGFRTAGKKLDMGKSCIHFKSADDLALDAVGDVVASVPVERWVAIAQSARRR